MVRRHAHRRLMAGDRLTVVAELPDLERLIRREAVPTASSVVVESVPVTAREGLRSLVMIKQNRSMEEADAAIRNVPFTLVEAMTRGEAQELVEQLSRDGIEARTV